TPRRWGAPARPAVLDFFFFGFLPSRTSCSIVGMLLLTRRIGAGRHRLRRPRSFAWTHLSGAHRVGSQPVVPSGEGRGGENHVESIWAPSGKRKVPPGLETGGALALTLPIWLTYNHMVVGSTVAGEATDRSEQTDRMFRALADPTRRDIVVRAMSGELSVSDLARHYPMSFAAVQKHVAVLEEAQLG